MEVYILLNVCTKVQMYFVIDLLMLKWGSFCVP